MISLLRYGGLGKWREDNKSTNGGPFEMLRQKIK